MHTLYCPKKNLLFPCTESSKERRNRDDDESSPFSLPFVRSFVLFPFVASTVLHRQGPHTSHPISKCMRPLTTLTPFFSLPSLDESSGQDGNETPTRPFLSFLPSSSPLSLSRADLSPCLFRYQQQRTHHLLRLQRNVREPSLSLFLSAAALSAELTTHPSSLFLSPSLFFRPKKFWSRLDLPYEPNKKQRRSDHYVTPPDLLSESSSREGGKGRMEAVASSS